ncbi:MAG: hypothetical protein KAR32_02990, partial [Candidatus Omnitrophica bacterium]|nr:hypothetical protein [Candidatus Omnitrophota bacterium]
DGVSNRPTDARYTVYYDGGSEIHYANQQVAGGQWVLLGTYPFAQGIGGYVQLDDDNVGQYTIADAIKLVYVGGSVSPSPTVSLTVAPDTITEGEPTTLIWSSADADSCMASNGWSGTKAVNGSEGVSPTVTTTYTLVCSGPGGNSAPSNVTVTVNPLPSVEDIIIDNTQAETVGSWGTSTAKSGYYPPNYAYNQSGSGADKMRWRPEIIVPGIYKVSYWLPNGISYSPNDAQYTIYYKDGAQTTRLVNQELPGGHWEELGQHEFAAGTSGYVELTDQNEGSYTFADAVKFEYVGGGTPPPTDTEAPNVPTGLNATAGSDVVIDLTWNASTDNVGVTGYRLFRDGVEVGTSATMSYSDTGLIPETTYSYTVTAYDAAANESGQSTSVSETTVSFEPPIVDDIIIDNTQAQTVGTWTASSAMPDHYPPNYYWNATGSGQDTVKWQPDIITAGQYEVSYMLPDGVS